MVLPMTLATLLYLPSSNSRISEGFSAEPASDHHPHEGQPFLELHRMHNPKPVAIHVIHINRVISIFPFGGFSCPMASGKTAVSISLEEFSHPLQLTRYLRLRFPYPLP